MIFLSHLILNGSLPLLFANLKHGSIEEILLLLVLVSFCQKQRSSSHSVIVIYLMSASILILLMISHVDSVEYRFTMAKLDVFILIITSRILCIEIKLSVAIWILMPSLVLSIHICATTVVSLVEPRLSFRMVADFESSPLLVGEALLLLSWIY